VAITCVLFCFLIYTFFNEWVGNAIVGSKSKGDVVQVTWDNVEELDAYIAKLKKAADQLSIENRQLRRCHFNISDKVRSLHLCIHI